MGHFRVPKVVGTTEQLVKKMIFPYYKECLATPYSHVILMYYFIIIYEMCNSEITDPSKPLFV